MQPIFKKTVIAVILFLAVLGVGRSVFIGLRKPTSEVAPLIEAPKNSGPKHEVIGQSVEGRNIEAFTYLPQRTDLSAAADGSELKSILFVGGMHGGYEWNSVLLAYQFIDYLNKNPGLVPENLTVTVIPSANPDGVYKVVGKEGRFISANASTNKEILASGRFNAHNVDLNRNFGCNWQPKSTWQSKTVSAGSAAFSEPETEAIRNFVLANKPDAVVFWHSQSNAVYASECNKGILPATLDIMNTYSLAAGYPAVKSFDSYAITGDAEGWLASIGIPAITVELKTHETIEWERNLAGIKALFGYYNRGIEAVR